MDYMEAYEQRLKNNHIKLVEFANACIDDGYDVYIHKDNIDTRPSYIHCLLIFRGEEHVSIYFQEVPYRWTINDIDVGLPTDTYALPFSLKSIEKYFTEVKRVSTNMCVNTRAKYLKHYSFYVPYDERKVIKIKEE